MNDSKPAMVGLVSNSYVRETYIAPDDLERLEEFAKFEWREFDESSDWDAPPDSDANTIKRLVEFAQGVDALIICHGAPRIGEAILSASKRLKFVGELEGDRFAQRIDVEACRASGVKVVDTTHGSSYPVSEWTLALMLLGLRNAGAHFRRMIRHETWGTDEQREKLPEFQFNEELTDKRVGMIGFGYIARKLVELLKPFNCDVLAYDPYIDRELGYAYDVTLTTLERTLSSSDVVVCLVPITPGTRKLLGWREFNMMKPGSVFVNVARGAVVDTDALIERLRRNDLIACLDVFDPEPMPADSPVRDMPNAFFSPHIAGTTIRSRRRFFEEMVKELRRFFSGDEVRHEITSRTTSNRSGIGL